MSIERPLEEGALYSTNVKFDHPKYGLQEYSLTPVKCRVCRGKGRFDAHKDDDEKYLGCGQCHGYGWVWRLT